MTISWYANSVEIKWVMMPRNATLFGLVQTSNEIPIDCVLFSTFINSSFLTWNFDAILVAQTLEDLNGIVVHPALSNISCQSLSSTMLKGRLLLTMQRIMTSFRVTRSDVWCCCLWMLWCVRRCDKKLDVVPLYGRWYWSRLHRKKLLLLCWMMVKCAQI